MNAALKLVIRWLAAKAICAVFGHRLEVAQHFSRYSRRVICRDCRGDWGMNDDVRAILPWDKDMEEMYRTSGKQIINPWR
jgi:hypothetical protein